MRVFVYYNLHSKQWSVKALTGPHKGLVIAHSEGVLLRDAMGRVNEKGRQRVLQERRKNVHAGIVGELIALKGYKEVKGREIEFIELSNMETKRDTKEITYNPYKYDSFVYKSNEFKFDHADFVVMLNKQVWVI